MIPMGNMMYMPNYTAVRDEEYVMQARVVWRTGKRSKNRELVRGIL